MSNNRKFTIFILALSLLLIILDQMTKFMVMGVPFLGIETKAIHPGEYISVIGDFLQLTYVENAGMAFGIKFGSLKIILTLFSLIASLVILYFIIKHDKANNWIRLGLAIILAGAMGNFIDRMFYGVWFQGGDLFYGRVVDFILVDIPDIKIGSLNYSHWPVFNIADSCVTIGVIILLFNYKHLTLLESKEKINEN